MTLELTDYEVVNLRELMRMADAMGVCNTGDWFEMVLIRLEEHQCDAQPNASSSLMLGSYQAAMGMASK